MGLGIFNNYKIKLIVLVFATFIWFFVTTENEYEHVIEIPINTVNLPENKVVLNEFPVTAKVKIKGPGKDLIALGFGPGARVDLDLSGVATSKIYRLSPTNVFLSRASGTIQVEEIVMPDSVIIILDKYDEKRVPIHSALTIAPAPGYTAVGDVEFVPDSVTVSGPKTLVAQIDHVSTEPKVFTNLTFDLEETVHLQKLPFRKVNRSAERAKIYQNIQKLLEITITGVPVQVRNAPRNQSVYVVPSTLSLVLEGGGDLLTQVSRDDIVAYLDFRRVRNNPAQEHPAVILTPPGVHYRDAKPKTFRLVFEGNPSN